MSKPQQYLTNSFYRKLKEYRLCGWTLGSKVGVWQEMGQYGGKHHCINFEGAIMDDWTPVYALEFQNLWISKGEHVAQALYMGTSFSHGILSSDVLSELGD